MKKSKLKVLSEYSILFIVYGFVYWMIENIYKGINYGKGSHWSMFVLGGLVAVIIGGLNEHCLTWEVPVWLQGAIGACVVTAGEFITGCIVNLWLGWNVWNYSGIPGNILGQICPIFSIIWFVFSILLIFLDDWLKLKLFKEKIPGYNWGLWYGKYKIESKRKTKGN